MNDLTRKLIKHPGLVACLVLVGAAGIAPLYSQAPETIMLAAPVSGVTIRAPRNDADGSFELFSDKVVFSPREGRQVDIPLGVTRFSVYGGYVDYVSNAGQLSFTYYGPRDNLLLVVQGRRFALAKGGSLTANHQMGDAGNNWTYHTVAGMADTTKVTEMQVSMPPQGLRQGQVQQAQPDQSVQGGGQMCEDGNFIFKQAGGGSGGRAGMMTPAPANQGLGQDLGQGAVIPSWSASDIRKRLYEKPAEEIVMRQLALQEAFALLARKAGINFVHTSPAGSFKASQSDESLITSRAVANPFHLLELLAFEQGCMVQCVGATPEFPDGVWVLRSLEREGLIGRTYRLKYAYSAVSSPKSGGAGGSSLSGGVPGGFGGGSSVTPANTMLFSSDGTKLQQDMASLLELTEAGLVVDGDTDFNQSDEELNRELDRLGVPMVRNKTQPDRQDKQQGPRSRVLYSELTGTLFVIAYRQQHEWVRGYLRAVDRPLRNIVLEVKFVETSRSPSENYGIQWPQSVRVGFGSRNNMNANTNSSLGNAGSATGGASLYVPGQNVAGLDQSGAAIPLFSGFPLVGLLSSSDLQLTLSALKSDAVGSNIRYYYCTVNENREVLVKNTEQVPILAASAQVSAGSVGMSGGTASQEVEYRDIGLIMNLKPKVVGDGEISLNISLNLSSISNYTAIGGISYPVPSMRTYEGPVTVKSGYSIAIGGLDESLKMVQMAKVPVLGSIPVLGRLFRSRTVRDPKNHLLVFITASLQNDYTTGVDKVRRNVDLGDWRGYYGGAADLADLKRLSDGLYSHINGLEQRAHDNELTPVDLPDLNALRADIRALLDDYDRLAETQGCDDGYRRQLSESSQRVRRLIGLFGVN